MTADESNSSTLKASGTAGLRQKAKETGSAAKDKLEALKGSARDLAHEAGDKVTEIAEERRVKAGGRVAQMARALNKAAEELDEGSTQRQVFERAAEGVDDLAAEIEGRSVGQLIGEVADFGRRHPATFIGGAALLGFALARFTSAMPVGEADAAEAPPATGQDGKQSGGAQ